MSQMMTGNLLLLDLSQKIICNKSAAGRKEFQKAEKHSEEQHFKRDANDPTKINATLNLFP